MDGQKAWLCPQCTVPRGAQVWVKIFSLLREGGVLEAKLSRKLLHITTGPFFVLTWALYSSEPSARLLACLVTGDRFRDPGSSSYTSCAAPKIGIDVP